MDEGTGGRNWMFFYHSETRLLSVLPRKLNSVRENLYEHRVSASIMIFPQGLFIMITPQMILDKGLSL